MKTAPKKLLNAIKEVVPLGAEVVPLSWSYEDEDYNIAVVVPDVLADTQGRDIESNVLDAITTYDEANGTFTVCMVWPERERERVNRN